MVRLIGVDVEMIVCVLGLRCVSVSNCLVRWLRWVVFVWICVRMCLCFLVVVVCCSSCDWIDSFMIGVCSLCVVLVMKCCCSVNEWLRCVSRLLIVLVSGWILFGIDVMLIGLRLFVFLCFRLDVIVCSGCSFVLMLNYRLSVSSGSIENMGYSRWMVMFVIVF